MIVRVLTDNGGPKPIGLIARVIEERDTDYTIQYLSGTEDRDRGKTVYRYEDEIYTIDDDYVIEYFDDEDEAGFVPSPDDGWIRRSMNEESDDEYDPGEDEEGEDEEECEDEEEDFEEDYDDEEYLDD